MEKVTVPVQDLVDAALELMHSDRGCIESCQVGFSKCDAQCQGDIRCRHLIGEYFMSVYPKYEGGE